jgi:hypothetical protein
MGCTAATSISSQIIPTAMNTSNTAQSHDRAFGRCLVLPESRDLTGTPFSSGTTDIS